MTTARTRRFLRQAEFDGPGMHASERWKKEFLAQMECARCRKKEDIDLYNYDKSLVDVTKYTVDELIARLPRMDTWCSSCGVRFNRFTTGEGRQNRKKDASLVAQLRSSANLSGLFDTYSTTKGRQTTKRELIDNFKNRPCQMCGGTFHLAAMDYHHIVEPKLSTISGMLHPRYSLDELIDEMEKCAIVCANCHRIISFGDADDSNLKPIVVRGNI